MASLPIISLLQFANILLTLHLLATLFSIGSKTNQGLFTKAIKLIFLALSMLFFGEILQAFKPFTVEALEIVMAVSTFLFLMLLVFGLNEIRTEVLAQAHLNQQRTKGHPIGVE
jgi:O-antigen ligase